MDYVSHLVAEEALSGVGPAARFCEQLNFADERKKAGRRFHDARSNDELPNKSRFALRRLMVNLSENEFITSSLFWQARLMTGCAFFSRLRLI